MSAAQQIPIGFIIVPDTPHHNFDNYEGLTPYQIEVRDWLRSVEGLSSPIGQRALLLVEAHCYRCRDCREYYQLNPIAMEVVFDELAEYTATHLYYGDGIVDEQCRHHWHEHGSSFCSWIGCGLAESPHPDADLVEHRQSNSADEDYGRTSPSPPPSVYSPTSPRPSPSPGPDGRAASYGLTSPPLFPSPRPEDRLSTTRASSEREPSSGSCFECPSPSIEDLDDLSPLRTFKQEQDEHDDRNTIDDGAAFKHEDSHGTSSFDDHAHIKGEGDSSGELAQQPTASPAAPDRAQSVLVEPESADNSQDVSSAQAAPAAVAAVSPRSQTTPDSSQQQQQQAASRAPSPSPARSSPTPRGRKRHRSSSTTDATPSPRSSKRARRSSCRQLCFELPDDYHPERESRRLRSLPAPQHGVRFRLPANYSPNSERLRLRSPIPFVWLDESDAE